MSFQHILDHEAPRKKTLSVDATKIQRMNSIQKMNSDVTKMQMMSSDVTRMPRMSSDVTKMQSMNSDVARMPRMSIDATRIQSMNSDATQVQRASNERSSVDAVPTRQRTLSVDYTNIDYTTTASLTGHIDLHAAASVTGLPTLYSQF